MNPLWHTTASLPQQTVLAQYVQEKLTAIHDLTKKAEAVLKTATGDAAFDAYVSGNPKRVHQQVAALYETIRQLPLTYRVEPPGPMPPRQEIRLAGTVLAASHRHGCCVDLVLLLAGALYNVGLYPLIVVVGNASRPEHAVLAYWTGAFAVTTGRKDAPNKRLPKPLLTWDDLQRHQPRLGFVECTDLVCDPSRDFDRARVDAVTWLPPNPGREVKYAVDVAACRELGIGPVDVDQSGQLLEAYLRSVIADCSPLKLKAVDDSAVQPRRQPIGLGQIYVDLDLNLSIPEKLSLEEYLADRNLAAAGGRRADVAAEGLVEREQRRVPLLEALAHFPSMVLLGPPGSGKSTFVAYVALCLAQARLGPGDLRSSLGAWWTHGSLIPVRVTLRQFAATMPPDRDPWRASDLWAFIQDELGKSGLPGKTFEMIQQATQESGALFLFDGLDEARDASTRVQVLQAVTEFARTAGARSRFLLTTRPYGWQDIEENAVRSPELAQAIQDHFPRWPLGDFGPDQIKTFITRWFQAVRDAGWMGAEEASEKAGNLQQAVAREEYLRLARNPLLLTLMATLLGSRMRLPDDRTDLYDSVVDLLLRRWNEAIELNRGLLHALQIPTLKLSDLRETMEHVAFEAHAAHQGREGVADIAEAALVAELRPLLQDRPDKAEIVLDYIERRTGLLLGQGARKGLRQYTFPHRSFQEFLAGCHLANQGDLNDQVERLAGESPQHWREVLRFAARRAGPARGVPAADGLVHCQDVGPWCRGNAPSDRDWKRATLAGEQLLEIGLAVVARQERHRVIRDRVAGWLERLVGEGHLPAPERAAAGAVLGWLGDRRPGVGLKDGFPDIDWIEIAAGKFLMGDKRQPVNIARAYSISRYPVTVKQYQAFVEAGGYKPAGRCYWTEAGWAWKTSHGIEGPLDFDSVFQTPNHPRVGVSWYEAVAFCRWLGERLKMEVSLPTGAQWERAARHTDGREYPWGDAGEAAQRCNMRETGIGHTSAVGMFPSGNAKCGAADMAGNVWEWCRTKYDHPADDDFDGKEDRVLRGVAWIYSRGRGRCADRTGLDPDFRDVVVGFRVVASPF